MKNTSAYVLQTIQGRLKKKTELKDKTNRQLVGEIFKDIREGTSRTDELNKLNRVLASRPAMISALILTFIICLVVSNIIASVMTGIADLMRGDPPTVSELFGLKAIFLPRYISRVRFPYILSLLVWLFSSVRYVYRVKSSIEPLNIGQKGHARAAYEEEIPRQYRKVPLLHEEYEGRHGFIVREEYDPSDPHEGWAYIDDSTSNLLVLGMTRSGKGECFVFPTIDMFSRVMEVQGEKDHMKPSMVITDPKRELYAYSKNILEERGYRVLRLDLLEPRRSVSYNVLASATQACIRGDMDEMENILRVFVETLYPEEKGTDKNSFFTDLGKQFILAFLYAHTEDAVFAGRTDRNNMCSVSKNIANLKIQHFQDPETKVVYSYLDEYFLSRPRMSRARELYTDILSQPSETKENILANATRKLSMYSSDLIARMTSSSSVSGYELGFGDVPIAMFISMPETNSAYYDIFSAFFNQISYDISVFATLNGGQTLRPVEYIFDEFGNLPPIPRIANNMTICLGKNVRFSFVIQSYTQLNTTYGNDVATTIADNCATEIYFLSKNQDTLKHFSEMLGNETITDIHRNGPKLSMNKSYMEQWVEHPLVSANELTELAEGECVIKRSIIRTDLEGNDIVPFPIVNRGKYRMQYRHRYGLYEDMPNTDIKDIDTQIPNTDIMISDLIYDLEPRVKRHCEKRLQEYEDRKKQAAAVKTQLQKKVSEENSKLDESDLLRCAVLAGEFLRQTGLTVGELRRLLESSGDISSLKSRLQVMFPREVASYNQNLNVLLTIIRKDRLDILEKEV